MVAERHHRNWRERRQQHQPEPERHRAAGGTQHTGTCAANRYVTARVVTITYTGNGGGQTIDFAGMTTPPTALFVMPATGVNGVEPIWWWDSRQGAASFRGSLPSFGQIWPQKGKFHVAHVPAGTSYNANGVNYIAIALFDPSGRYVLPFAVSKPTAEDNYTQYLRYPQSGGSPRSSSPTSSLVVSRMDLTAMPPERAPTGPGTRGRPDREARRGAGVGSRPYPGGWRRHRAIRHHRRPRYLGDQAFWAGRVSDGVSSTRLMAVTLVRGDGTASRNIALTLSGSCPSVRPCGPDHGHSQGLPRHR